MDARLITRVIATGRVIQTRTVRNCSHDAILERAYQTTLAVARAYDQPPDTLTTKVEIVKPDNPAVASPDPFATEAAR